MTAVQMDGGVAGQRRTGSRSWPAASPFASPSAAGRPRQSGADESTATRHSPGGSSSSTLRPLRAKARTRIASLGSPRCGAAMDADRLGACVDADTDGGVRRSGGRPCRRLRHPTAGRRAGPRGAGAAARGRARADLAAAARSAAAWSSLERAKVPRGCGSGGSPSSRRRRTPRAGPWRTASTRSASPWATKYGNGAVSPYSSPMKSRGTKGESSTAAAASFSALEARASRGARRACGCRPGRGSATKTTKRSRRDVGGGAAVRGAGGRPSSGRRRRSRRGRRVARSLPTPPKSA